MIDWLNVGENALWILGCALALATVSAASWEASLCKEKLSQWLVKPGYSRSLYLAGALFSAGLAATSQPLWQAILWALLGIIFLIQMTLTFKTA